jgi:carotenoid cleavage oxygenase
MSTLWNASPYGERRVRGPAQPFYDLSNTNVMPVAGRLVALTEGCHPYVLDEDLTTVGRADFGGSLPYGLTAHPKLDPLTGELHAIAYGWEAPRLLYHRICPEGVLVQTETIALPAPVSMHDFAVTEHHVLFLDQPAVFDLGAMATSGFPYRWRPEHGARLGLLPRDGHGGDVRWIDAPLGYSFHLLNAFEVGRQLIVDLPLLPHVFTGDHFESGAQGFLGLQRWTVDLDCGRLSTDVLDDQPQEFGKVRDERVGRAHRYGYTVELGARLPFSGTRVFKHDTLRGTRDGHDFGPGRHPGELVFVPDPDRPGAEDGGWLVGFVHPDGGNETTFTILDAQDLPGPPVAEVVIPRRVPHGLHGCWLPA